MSEIGAEEAAARLGVKKATLYAYVSRGLVHRRMALDGRTSLFDAEEIEALRTGRRRVASGELGTVIATAIADVSDRGLRLRGHDAVALVRAGAGFEAMAELVWFPEDSVGVDESWATPADLVAAVEHAVSALPDTARPLDRLRVACAVASALDPMRFEQTPGSVATAGRRLIGAMVASLPVVGAQAPHDQTTVAEALWIRLSPQPATPPTVRALDAALALLVDHGLATSTLGARIAASVRADPYSVVTAGLGVLGGVLHGAASASVHRLLAAAAAGDPETAIGAAVERWGSAPGHGHTIYAGRDPRDVALAEIIDDAWAGDPRRRTPAAVRTVVADRGGAPANVDMALGTLTWLADMSRRAGEVVFAIARTAGWLAHAVEELDEPPLRFRPRARYVGR